MYAKPDEVLDVCFREQDEWRRSFIGGDPELMTNPLAAVKVERGQRGG